MNEMYQIKGCTRKKDSGEFIPIEPVYLKMLVGVKQLYQEIAPVGLQKGDIVDLVSRTVDEAKVRSRVAPFHVIVWKVQDLERVVENEARRSN